MKAVEAIVILVVIAVLVIAITTGIVGNWRRTVGKNKLTVDVREISSEENGVYLNRGGRSTLFQRVPKGDEIALELAVRDARKVKKSLED